MSTGKKLRCIIIVVLLAWLVIGCMGGRAESGDLAVIIENPDGETVVFRFPEDETSMRIRFGGEDAGFGLYTATCAFLDDLTVTTEGSFSGDQVTSVYSLERELTFAGVGEVDTVTQRGETIARYRFSGSGSFTEGFETCDACEDEYAYVLLRIEYFTDFWIDVVDGIVDPGPPPELPTNPRLRLLALESTPAGVAGGGGGGGGSAEGNGHSTGGRDITLVLGNVGTGVLYGPATVHIGLSYSPAWVSESEFCFVNEEITQSTLVPHQQGMIQVFVPPIPQELYRAFQERRSFYGAYTDPEPEQDYLGIRVSYGHGTHVYAFLPLEQFTETMAVRKDVAVLVESGE